MNTIKERKFQSLIIDDNIEKLTNWLSNQKLTIDEPMIEKIFLAAAMGQSENILNWCFELSNDKPSLLKSKNQFDNSGLWLLCPWATEKIISTIKPYIVPDMLHFVGAQKSSPLLLAASHANWNMTQALFEIYPNAAQHSNVDKESFLERLLYPSYYHRNETAHFKWTAPPTDFFKKVLDSQPIPKQEPNRFPILIKSRAHPPHLYLLWDKISKLPEKERSQYLNKTISKITILDYFIFSKDAYMIGELLKTEAPSASPGLSSSTIAFKHLDFDLASKILTKQSTHFFASENEPISNLGMSVFCDDEDVYSDPFQTFNHKKTNSKIFKNIPQDVFSAEVLSLIKATLTSSIDKEKKLNHLLSFFNQNILLLSNKYHQSIFPFAIQNLDLNSCKQLLELEPKLLNSAHHHEFLGPLEAAAKSNIDSTEKLKWLHSLGCKPLIINDTLWQSEAKTNDKHIYNRFINGDLMRQHLSYSYIYRLTNDKTQQLNQIHPDKNKETTPATLLSIDHWRLSEQVSLPSNTNEHQITSSTENETQSLQVHPDFLTFACKNNLVHAIDWLEEAGYEFNENQLAMATYVAIASSAKEDTLTKLWDLHKKNGLSPWNESTTKIAYQKFSPQRGNKFNLPKFDLDLALTPEEGIELNNMEQAIDQVCTFFSFDLTFENSIPTLLGANLSLAQKKNRFVSSPDIPVGILWGHLLSNVTKVGSITSTEKLLQDLPEYAKLAFSGSPFSKLKQKNTNKEDSPQIYIEALKEQIFFELDICAKKLLIKKGKIYSANPLKDSIILKHKNIQYNEFLQNILFHKKNDPELINLLYDKFLKHAHPTTNLKNELNLQDRLKNSLISWKKDENVDVFKETLYLNTKNILENEHSKQLLIANPKTFSSFFSTLVLPECFQLAEHLLEKLPFGVDKNELAKSFGKILSSNRAHSNNSFTSLCYKKIVEYSTFLSDPQNNDDNVKIYKTLFEFFEPLCRSGNNRFSESKKNTIEALEFLNNLPKNALQTFYQMHSEQFPEIAQNKFIEIPLDSIKDPVSRALNNGKTILAKEIIKKLPTTIVEEYRTTWHACFLNFLQKEISQNSDCLVLNEKEKQILETLDGSTLDVWHYEEPKQIKTEVSLNEQDSLQHSTLSINESNDDGDEDCFFLSKKPILPMERQNEKPQLFQIPDALSLFKNKSTKELLDIYKFIDNSSYGIKQKLNDIQKNLNSKISDALVITILSKKFDDFVSALPMTDSVQNTHALLMAAKNDGYFYGRKKLHPEETGWVFLHHKKIPFESNLNYQKFGQYFSKTKHPAPELVISMPLVFALLSKSGSLSLNNLATWKEAQFCDNIENLPKPIKNAKPNDDYFKEPEQTIPSNIRQYLSESELSKLENFELEQQVTANLPTKNKTIKHL